jgi:VWFA-related protein
LGSFVHVREALQNLFKEEQGFDSQYALIALGRPTRLIQNSTRDPAAVLAALGNKDLTRAILSSESSNMAQQETELMHRLGDFCNDCKPFCAGENMQCLTTPTMPWNSIVSWANMTAQERQSSARDFVRDLRGLTEQLSRMPGRRVLILASDGFNFQPGRELFALMAAATKHPEVMMENPTSSLQDEIQTIVKLANAHNVTFYTLDSRGLYAPPAGGFDISQNVSMVGVPEVQSAKETSTAENQDAMNYLAEATGGVFYHDSNDILKGLRQSFADGRQYYVLAYDPSNGAADGKFRTIKVQVKGRNLMVRAKSGYWASAENIPTADATKRAEPPRLAAPLPAGNMPTTPAPTSAELLTLAAPAPSFVDLPTAELVRKLPALKNLTPAASQELLSSILQKVGANVAILFDSFPNVTSRERVLEERLEFGSHHDQMFQEFRYLALVSPDTKQVGFKEYRTDFGARLVQPTGLESGYLITKGFASIPLYFHPSSQPDSKFRYLGQEVIDKRATYVVAFAQTLSARQKVRIVANNGRSVSLLVQGLAWIDPASDQIIRMQTDLLAPAPEIKFDSQTTRIKLVEVRFKSLASGFWLPREVEVETSCNGVIYRNTHYYSEYKQFSVEVQERQGAPTSP